MTTALLPPGPPPVGFLGRIPCLIEFSRDQLGYMTRYARKYGDVVRMRGGKYPAYLVNRADLIETVLLNKGGAFAKTENTPGARALQRVLGNGLLTSEGDFWLRQRRLVQPAFHRQRLLAYSQTMVEYTERMLETWRDGDTRDIHQAMMRLTLQIVAKTLFNADVTHHADRVGQALEAFMDRFANQAAIMLLPENLPTPANIRSQRAVERLDAIIYDIIRERRDSGKDEGDLLSMLLHVQDEDGRFMSDHQLRDEVVTLFLAGHETTALALSWMFYLLAQIPDADAKLADELRRVLGDGPLTADDLPKLSYTDAVVKEAMRLYPPAPRQARQATADCELGGYRIPAGAIIIVSQWVTQRDPRYFDHPDTFDPDRWLDGLERRLPRYAYFPFGAGPHMCIGSGFATMEANLLLACIARRFCLDLAPGQAIIPQVSVTLRPKHAIRMTLHAR